jgi:hypothetical protein
MGKKIKKRTCPLSEAAGYKDERSTAKELPKRNSELILFE